METGLVFEWIKIKCRKRLQWQKQMDGKEVERQGAVLTEAEIHAVKLSGQSES